VDLTEFPAAMLRTKLGTFLTDHGKKYSSEQVLALWRKARHGKSIAALWTESSVEKMVTFRAFLCDLSTASNLEVPVLVSTVTAYALRCLCCSPFLVFVVL